MSGGAAISRETQEFLSVALVMLLQAPLPLLSPSSLCSLHPRSSIPRPPSAFSLPFPAPPSPVSSSLPSLLLAWLWSIPVCPAPLPAPTYPNPSSLSMRPAPTPCFSIRSLPPSFSSLTLPPRHPPLPSLPSSPLPLPHPFPYLPWRVLPYLPNLPYLFFAFLLLFTLPSFGHLLIRSHRLRHNRRLRLMSHLGDFANPQRPPPRQQEVSLYYRNVGITERRWNET
ncbi:hypothetical protein DFH08DRAFT_975344 [Mycena albidolilacea]|uniref:Uncharacterized protein n=1 Tax=Mycena albidolilacea TaxID=1033008 RepID=A0AAD6Z5L9_9AGAR|nr:hypothetical protein DFH08DRAFT_975344 [Mycena albidolilacea]